jgi:HD-like signal output (HDOD) protein
MMATPISRETLLHVVRQLPASPHILAQLGQLLIDPNSDMSEITALLKCDTALTARIIRISNSALYNTGQSYTSLEEALARVGYNEVYRLTGLAAVAQISDRDLACYEISGPQLRENSLLTALISEALAGFSEVDPRMAYTAGLLRSVGKIALDRLASDCGPAGRRDAAASSGGGLAAWESGLLGMNNGEAAATILAEWRFSAATVAGIREQYLLRPNPAPLANLLNLAAGAADRAGHALPGETLYWETSAEKYAGAGVKAEDVEEATRRALQVFGPLRAAVA